MFWDVAACSSESARILEMKKALTLRSLKNRISQNHFELQARLQVLDHERRQFEKRYAASIASGRRRRKAETRSRHFKLFSLPFEKEKVEKWVTAGQHFRTLYSKRGNRLIGGSDLSEEDKDVEASEEEDDEEDTLDVDVAQIQLPTIQVDQDTKSISASRRSPPTFVTEMHRLRERSYTCIQEAVDEEKESFSLGKTDMYSANQPSDLTGNTIQTASDPIPARNRSSSLPALYQSSAIVPKADAPKFRCFESKGKPLRLLRRGSNTYNMVGGRRRSSAGVSMAKVISNMSHGVMFNDPAQRQETVLSEEEWEQLRGCRYLRQPRPKSVDEHV